MPKGLEKDPNNFGNVQGFRLDDVVTISAGGFIDVDSDDYLAFCAGDGADIKLGSSGTVTALNAGDIRVINRTGEDIYFVAETVIQVMK